MSYSGVIHKHLLRQRITFRWLVCKILRERLSENILQFIWSSFDSENFPLFILLFFSDNWSTVCIALKAVIVYKFSFISLSHFLSISARFRWVRKWPCICILSSRAVFSYFAFASVSTTYFSLASSIRSFKSAFCNETLASYKAQVFSFQT